MRVIFQLAGRGFPFQSLTVLYAALCLPVTPRPPTGAWNCMPALLCMSALYFALWKRCQHAERLENRGAPRLSSIRFVWA